LEQDAERARLVPALAPGAHELEDRAEIASLDELHREEDAAIRVHAELVHRQDAGVVELRGDLRLLEEARGLARVRGGGPERELLQRQRPVQLRVLRTMDDAHAAAREHGLLPEAAAARDRPGELCQALEQPAARLRRSVGS